MTRQEAIDRLREAQRNGDVEEAHGTANDVLCDLLVALGYQDVVDEWKAVQKWYA